MSKSIVRQLSFLCLLFGMMSFVKSETLKVADMEGETKYSSHGSNAKPNVSFSSKITSRGKRSLYFSYTAQGKSQAYVSFPIKETKDYNTFAFDIYCSSLNGAKLEVVLRNGCRYKSQLNLADFIDGWTTVELIKDSSLIFRGNGKPDWAHLDTVFFTISGAMSGTCSFYLDNIRFIKQKDLSPNILYNSSFEVATNPDVPDGWMRGWYSLGPPYGQEIWGVDNREAYHGKKSLRVSRTDVITRSWARHTRIIKGKSYTFSIYLKSDGPATKAKLEVRGLGNKEVEVNKEWQRYYISGKAKNSDTLAIVKLLTKDAVLWMDAAQLEMGDKPTIFKPGPEYKEKFQSKSTVSKHSLAISKQTKPVPKLEISSTQKAPVIDGVLDDTCWSSAPCTKPFVKLKKNEPASPATSAQILYDDQYIYFAIRANDPNMDLVRKHFKQNKKNLWKNDLVEFFLDLNNDRKTYYHFATDLSGNHYEARHTTSKNFKGKYSDWSGKWDSAVHMNDQGWTLEARIPFTCFDMIPPIAPLKKIGLNITRQNPRDKKYSSWAFAHGAFHNPNAFGTAQGLTIDATPYKYIIENLNWYKNNVEATIINQTGHAQKIKVNFHIRKPEDKTQTTTWEGTIEPKQRQFISLPAPIASDGNYQLWTEIFDSKGIKRGHSQLRHVHVKGSSLFRYDGTEFDFYTSDKNALARYYLQATEKSNQSLLVSWSLENQDQILLQNKFQPKSGLNQWAVPIFELKNGDYILKVNLSKNGKTIIKKQSFFRKLAPAPHEVRINRWGRYLVCDGKPFMNYGFFCSLPKGKDRNIAWAEALTMMKKAHCNVVLESQSSIVRAKGQYDTAWVLDTAQQNGMKVWVHLSPMLTYWIPKYSHLKLFPHEEAAIKAIEDVVQKNKNNPALLGWCTLDEPGNRPHLFTKEFVEKYYHLIKKLDPYHPCIISHMNHPLKDVELYSQATDMILTPFQARSSKSEYSFHTFWDTGLPIMTNAPCWGALSGVVREPTPAEQRINMYEALILGSRGFVTYLYRPATKFTWKELGIIGKEFATLAPLLLNSEEPLRLEIQPSGSGVFALLKANKQYHLLVTVNTSLKPVRANFFMPDLTNISSVKPLFSTKAELQDQGKQHLTVNMEPQSTAVYKICTLNQF